MLADIEMRRFFAYQASEARKLGYPRMSAFAKDIAKGTLAPAPVEEDPVMDAVGAFYGSLKEIERRILTEFYEGAGSKTERARALGISRRKFYEKVDRLLVRCMDRLRERAV